MPAIHTPKTGVISDVPPVARDALQPGTETEPTEVLFPEAKRRERHRRLLVLAAVGVALGATGLGYALSSGSPPPAKPTPSVHFALAPAIRPSVNAEAFAGNGRLALVSQQSLWVLDGATKKLREVAVPDGDIPSNPMYSPDGRWLAYLAASTSPTTGPPAPIVLCVAKGNGSDPRELGPLGGPNEEAIRYVIGWSPVGDHLAYATAHDIGPSPTEAGADKYNNVRYDVDVWQPGRSTNVLATVNEFTGGAWSPKGTQIAVGSDTWQVFGHNGLAASHTSSLTAYPLSGAHPVIWREQTVPRGNNANNILYFIPVGWWSKWGIAYSAGDFGGDAYDSSQWNGSYPISVIARPGGATTPLASVMLNGADGPIAVSSTGAIALTTNGFAHPVWQAESVEICEPTTRRCSPVTTPPGTVSADPEWSADGTKLAYVVGAQSSTNQGQEPFLEHWYDSLKLEVYDATTKQTIALGAGTGSAVPVWSSAGSDLLLVRDDAIWLWTTGVKQPVQVAAPLFTPAPAPDGWPSFYGQIDWSGQFAWAGPSR